MQILVSFLKGERSYLLDPLDPGSELGLVMHKWYKLYYKPLKGTMKRYNVAPKDRGEWRNLFHVFNWRLLPSAHQHLYLRNDGYAGVNLVAVFLLHIVQSKGVHDTELRKEIVTAALKGINTCDFDAYFKY